MFQKGANNKGFTLVELLVSMVVFGIFIGMFINTYFYLSKTLTEINANRRVYIEARNLMEQMAQEMRKKTVDYDCYENKCWEGVEKLSSSKGEESVLVLVSSKDEERVFFKKDNSGQIVFFKQKWKVVDSKEGTGNWITADGFNQDEWKKILGEKVKALDLRFLISPANNVDNLIAEGKEPFHPRATVLMSLEGEKIKFEVQKTISSRVY